MSLFSETLALIKQNNLQLRRRLGQNFLIDENILNKIIAAAEFSKDEIVLEIGTGFGFITAGIAPLVKKIITYEIDRGVLLAAREVLAGFQNVVTIHNDFLKANLSKFPSSSQTGVKIFGNLPYNITSLIFEKIFKNLKKIRSGFFLVQKEFAARILAGPGSQNYSSFSIFCQYHARFQKLFNVSPGCFFPRPQVASVFIKMIPQPKPAVNLVDEKLFFNIIRDTFAKRRKTLVNALTDSKRVRITEKKLKSALSTLKIDPMIRGENLSLQEFAQLANLLAK
jgi:16S rRNA (adenine1518-N6/adenine1519-N6)-dimethyltransferase